MPINIDRETIERIFTAGMKKVRKADIAKVINRSPTLRRFVRGPLADLAGDVTTLTAMVKDYASGKYREVPEKTILTATVALLYIINPLDLIPDLVPGLGLIDDAAVLTMVVKAIQSDLQNYRSWAQKFTRRMRQIAARI
jgi:uncharacterized membrane protein YkvA (DUF1232 family)